LIVEGRVEAIDGQEITLIVSDVRDLIEAVPKNARAVSITLPAREFDDEYFTDLFSVLNNTQGRCDVYLQFPVGDVEVKIQSQPLRIQGSSRIQNDLEARRCRVEWVL
jgi:hypothetical protein